MAGQLLTGSDISTLILSTGGYGGKSYRRTWWNSAEARWDGLVAKLDGDASSDHYIVTDIGGTNTFTSIELEDRTTGKPTIFWDDTNKTLYCVSAHDSDFQFWKLTYSAGVYSFDIGVGGTGVTITGLTRDGAQRDEGIGLVVSPNGNVWVANMQNTSNQLQVAYSTDSGATWETVQTLVTAAAKGCVDMTSFANSGNFVAIYASENGAGGATGKESFFFYANETTPTSWTSDTGMPAADAGAEFDDHVCMTKDSNDNMYMVYKAEGIGEDDIKVVKRTPAGVWSGAFEAWNDSDNLTRPTIAIKKKDASSDEEMIVTATLTGDGQIAYYKTSDLDTISFTAGLGTTLFEDTVGTDTFNDITAPQAGFIATSTSGIAFLINNVTDETIWETALSIVAKVVKTVAARKFFLGL